MSKRIELSNGRPAFDGADLGHPDYVIVDDCDYASVSNYDWRWMISNRAAVRDDGAKPRILVIRQATEEERDAGSPSAICMHRQLFGLTKKKDADRTVVQANGNPFDNRRDNLREDDHRHNAQRMSAYGKSGIKGSYPQGNGSFRSLIIARGANGKLVSTSLGTFDSAEEAGTAYDEAARLIYGPKARLNAKRAGFRSPSKARRAEILVIVREALSKRPGFKLPPAGFQFQAKRHGADKADSEGGTESGIGSGMGNKSEAQE